MKKLYLLHIATFIASIFIRWDWIIKFDIVDIFIKAILNISLLNTFSSKNAFVFNALSWFLSVTFLLYIIAIPLMIFIKNNKSNIKFQIIFILILQNLIMFINQIGEYNLSLYTSPFFRVFDFMIGMFLAKLFIKNKYKKDMDDINYSKYETIIFISFCMLYIISVISKFKIEVGLSYYSPIFILGIYIMAFEKGYISKFLAKDIFRNVAKFSFEFYMIHELILIFFGKVFINIEYHWIIKTL